jgi:hypothetical protein
MEKINLMEKYKSLKKNKTWILTTLLVGRLYVIGCKSLCKVQLKFDDSIDHYKICFIVKGCCQITKVDYILTY